MIFNWVNFGSLCAADCAKWGSEVYVKSYELLLDLWPNLGL